MYKNEIPGLEAPGSHSKILNTIHEGVTAILEKDQAETGGSMKCELLENSYMFFISKISKNGD